MRRTTIVWACMALALSARNAAAQQIDAQALRLKQDTQQRARDLARELVTSILDIQLQQLEENALEDLPLYRDIRQMRTNIDGLVEAEMADVVDLLVRAQGLEAKPRDALFVEARQKTRDVVVRLSIERQNLLRRLKAAELAAQVKRLIEVQTVVHNATRTLSAQPKERQESSLLATIEDQRDGKTLYLRLEETMQDVRTWGGEVGNGAAEGLALLKKLNVGDDLDGALSNLETARFAESADHQAAALKGLRLLLEQIEQTQGLVDADREVALATVRELIEAQEKLREQTRQADLNDATIDPLVEKQTSIEQELARLPDLLTDEADALPLVEQAHRAARSATAQIFDAQRDAAAAEQAKVLRQLAALEQQLSVAARPKSDDKSAAQYADLVRDLEQARRAVETARRDNQQLAEQTQRDAPDAVTRAEQLARDVGAIGKASSLPGAAQSALADATEQARQTARELEAPESSPDDRSQAVARTEQQLERAAAELAAAQADAERRRLAVEIGELARAAEALERAAASERAVARQAAAADKKQGIEPATAGDLAERQSEINKVVEKVAEAIAPTAARSAEMAGQARQAAQMAADSLRTPMGQPVAPIQAARAAEQARSAAEKMAGAAEQLRGEIAARASQLAQESQRQLAEVTPARQATEQAAAIPENSPAKRLERLAEAEEQVRRATIEQQRAAGRADVATAMELRHQIDQARQRQAEAQQAAEDADMSGDSPLNAAARQQQAAEAASKASEAAESRPMALAAKDAGQRDPLSDALREAEQRANQAAKAALAGKRGEAQVARRQAQQALDEATQLAEAEARRAASTPAGKADSQAQERAAAAAQRAQQLAATDVPAADKPLSEAQAMAAEANRQAAAGNEQAGDAARSKAEAALEAAQRAIAAAQAEAARQQSAQLAERGKQTGRLAAQAARLDPAAREALRAAEQMAGQAAEQAAAQPRGAAAAEQPIQRAVQQAASSLTAREEQIMRDRTLAEAILAAAKAQQLAAAAIAEKSRALTNPPPKPATPATPPGTPTPPTPAQAQAAQLLQHAMKAFGKASRSLGQSVEEIAGQTDVANEALRDALQMASKFVPEPIPVPAGAPQESAPAAPATASRMGTQFTPATPEATSQSMAGPEALAAAQQAMAESAPATETNPAGEAASMATATKPESANPPGDKSAQTTQGSQTPEAPGTRTGDTRPGARTFGEQPWAAKLPPEERAAMRAQSGRRSPRGYEDRLRRYFQSIPNP